MRPPNNLFHAINSGRLGARDQAADVVVFVNGCRLWWWTQKLSREETDFFERLPADQTTSRNPSLFQYNAFCVISDLFYSRSCTITGDLTDF
jgi:type I restriction enzyme R subunit